MKAPKSVNEPFHKMTEAELRENHAYWAHKVETAAGPASAMQAGKFADACAKELRRRNLDAPDDLVKVG